MTGEPCSCTFDWTKFGQPNRIAKVAGKLHDFLMNPRSRPDLQTPEGQAWLKLLERHQETIGPKLDPLTPWLTREWKKGRIQHDIPSANMGDFSDPANRAWADRAALGRMSYIPDGEGQRRRDLPTSTLSHWADFHQSNHPLRRGLGDIMQHQVTGYHDLADQWTEALQAEAKEQALAGGEVVHTTPSNWTIRRLTTPEELSAEGETMGHCVGGYAHDVEQGRSLIYSLRDPEGKPHVTTEIQPTMYERKDSLGTHRNENRSTDDDGYMDYPIPHGGNLIQIQGKSDQMPLPEYQEQMKDWFQSFPEEDRPNWETPGGDITHIGALVPEAETWDPHYGIGRRGDPDTEEQGGYGAHGDYGLVTPKRRMNYEQTLQSLIRPRQYHEHREGGGSLDPDEIQALYEEARGRGEIPQFGDAVSAYQQKAYEDRDSLEEQMWDAPSYPGEAYDEEPERWDALAEENPHEYTDGEDAFNEAQSQYQTHQETLDSEHLPTQVANQLYNHLNQHAVAPLPSGYLQYQNELKSGGQLTPNEQQLEVQQLPQGAQYTDLGGQINTVGDEDKRYHNPRLVPPHIALPPEPSQPPTFAKVGAYDPVHEPIDPRTLPLYEWDSALREMLNDPSRFTYKYRESIPDWGDQRRHRFDVTHSGAPATHTFNDEWGKTKTYGYDPDLADPEDNRFGTTFRLRPHPEWKDEAYRNEAGDLVTPFEDEVQADPSMLYRGLSHEEWEQAKQRGYFQSNGEYNLGKEQGTLYSTDPSQARSYASGFAPWHRKPGFNAPSYVIGVPRPEGAHQNPGLGLGDTTEMVVPGQVPFDQVRQAWQFRPYAAQNGSMELRTENYGEQWGGRPDTSYHQFAWRPMPLGPPPRQSRVKLATPLYVRWAFSPASSEVMLADNEGDPLNVQYHGDMAAQLNEPNLVHGYAYRLQDGWRLFDWENRPLEDPFIIAQVMRKLVGEHSSPQDLPQDPDFSRMHQGLPT